MSRPPRIEFEDALYHVTTRGNRRASIFIDDADRIALLQTIGRALQRYHATAFAYCLMGNHYHIVVQTHRPNLSRVMQFINGVHAQQHNRRHALEGHLFQGRFHAVIVQRDAYLLEVCRYVDRNPVRAGLVSHPAEWLWSSYRALVGGHPRPSWLTTTTLYECLAPHAPLACGADAYARFVAHGTGSRLWETSPEGQLYLGDDDFTKAMQRRVDSLEDPELTRIQHRPMPEPLGHFLAEENRNLGIARAHIEGGYPQTAIARATGLSVSRISRLISAQQAKGKV